MRCSILFVVFFFSYNIFVQAQDQIIFINKDSKYVDKILEVENDTLIYKNFKIIHSIPLSTLQAYYRTINTKENLTRSFYKRERTYHFVNSVQNNKELKINLDSNFIVRQFSSNKVFNDKDFSDGFFIQNNDTVFCKIYQKKKKLNAEKCLFFIYKDSQGLIHFKDSKEVQCYNANNIKYKRIKPTKTYSFFVRLIVDGNVKLYERAAIPSDNSHAYYVYRDGMYYSIKETDTSD